MSRARRRKVHTAKWDRCVRHVKRAGSADSPHAVCTATLGRKSFLKRSRRSNPPRRPTRAARVLDPEHKKLLAILARHFGKDERPGRKGRGQVTTTTTTSNTKRTTRKANPREYFKIWARIRGRTWFWYTGEDFSAAFKRPRLYVTARQAMKVARALRRKFPTLRRRTLVVSTKRPAHDL